MLFWFQLHRGLESHTEVHFHLSDCYMEIIPDSPYRLNKLPCVTVAMMFRWIGGIW